ncbi:MAG: hypothetical protein HY854_17220 [Burkholderiales bacterium]|nr:hypothetical protein [Burkholderiales bacterium]
MKACLLLLACLLALAGCATVPAAPPAAAAAALPWQDRAFDYDASRAAIGKEELFWLPPDLAQRLAAPGLQEMGTWQRVDALMVLILGADRRGFSYREGHSTTASQTWQERRGDCLSLTVLTYAAARALGLEAQMQEVRVPALHARRGGLEYVNRHVNVLFKVLNRSPVEDVLQARHVVVDFEPQFATPFRGQVLSDAAVLAHFHNNLGVEALADGKRALAYAHFRAALAADPQFVPAYGNLAVLYRQQGLDGGAEQWLRQALGLRGDSEVALRALHELLQAQGRDAEAKVLAQRVQRLQDSDPYYWIAEGMQHLFAGQSARAAAALERAEMLTSGFGEVHRYLAVAYWNLGERERARRHLDQLAVLDLGGHVTAKLRRKFGPADAH